jgi:hypothetical protein
MICENTEKEPLPPKDAIKAMLDGETLYDAEGNGYYYHFIHGGFCRLSEDGDRTNETTISKFHGLYRRKTVPIAESYKCSHIPNKTADDCLECVFMKPGPVEGSGICKYPIKQEESMTGIERIAAERKRQIDKENFTVEHDDQWNRHELAMASLCYVMPPSCRYEVFLTTYWPWQWEWWKPTHENRIRELEKAGALIAAEIDRLLRPEVKS